MKNLSQEQIQYLISLGFVQNDALYSGYYYHQDGESSKVSVLIAYEDGSFKLEFYEWLPDGDGGWYEDFNKDFSKDGQTLEEFLKSNFE